MDTVQETKLFRATNADAGEACFSLMDLDNPCEIAVRGTAYVECALIRALRRKLRTDMTSNEETRLFHGYGPLASFSSKISLGFALGLYDREVKRDLEAIKKVRNEFAHRLSIAGFEDLAVVEACKKMNCGRDAGIYVEPRDAKPSERFEYACHMLVAVLDSGMRAYETTGATPAAPPSPVPDDRCAA